MIARKVSLDPQVFLNGLGFVDKWDGDGAARESLRQVGPALDETFCCLPQAFICRSTTCPAFVSKTAVQAVEP